MAQTKSGRNLRWYFQGSAVGMGRMTMLKPDVAQGLDAVKECGTPDVVEYVLKVPETSIQFGWNVINKAQLANAMGQTSGGLNSAGGVGGSGVGEVPSIPQSFDVVERRIKAGTEGTTGEVVEGYTIYQAVQVEKKAWDQEVDKLVGASINGKCREPRDFEGINGIAFDKFTPNGVLTAFVLTHKSIQHKDGLLTIRGEFPLGTVLKEGVDYTVASTSSSTTCTFSPAPASSAVPNILFVYAW
jgi:hypothetical protein